MGSYSKHNKQPLKALQHFKSGVFFRIEGLSGSNKKLVTGDWPPKRSWGSFWKQETGYFQMLARPSLKVFVFGPE